MKSVILSTLKNLESQVAALRAALNEIPTEASPPVQPKEKRELSAAILKMNGERGAIFEELKAAWSSAHPEYVALDAAALKSAVKSGAVPAKPRFSDALQEHSRRLRENDPAKQAKYEAYRKSADAKTAKIQAARAAPSEAVTVSAPASVTSTSEKKERKNPWLDLTEEQKAERKAKMAAGKEAAKKVREAAAASVAAPVAVTASVAVAAPASTASNAAAAPAVAEKRPVKVAPKAAASAPAPAPAPAPVAAAVEVVEASADDEEAFQPFEFKGTKYWKNGLQYVYKKTSDGGFGDYLGRYDVPKRKIDTTVPEPPVED